MISLESILLFLVNIVSLYFLNKSKFFTKKFNTIDSGETKIKDFSNTGYGGMFSTIDFIINIMKYYCLVMMALKLLEYSYYVEFYYQLYFFIKCEKFYEYKLINIPLIYINYKNEYHQKQGDVTTPFAQKYLLNQKLEIDLLKTKYNIMYILLQILCYWYIYYLCIKYSSDIQNITIYKEEINDNTESSPKEILLEKIKNSSFTKDGTMPLLKQTEIKIMSLIDSDHMEKEEE